MRERPYNILSREILNSLNLPAHSSSYESKTNNYSKIKAKNKLKPYDPMGENILLRVKPRLNSLVHRRTSVGAFHK